MISNTCRMGLGCLQGLWLWSQPVQRVTPEGLRYHLLLVDCEGIDAYDQTLDYSTQVFSLGVLLSSLLIYNQVDDWKNSHLCAILFWHPLVGRPWQEGA